MRLFWLPLLIAPLIGVSAALAHQARDYDDSAEIAAALAEAKAQGETARKRAEQLEAEARSAVALADRTAKEAAGVAARIQQGEAGIAAQQALIRQIERQRRILRLRLAEKQRPLVRLTASLQRLSRRPPALSLLRPGSLRETMYLRAILETMLPEVQRRTASVRAEIARSRQLRLAAVQSVARLRASESGLQAQRKQLVALETRQRLASRAAGGVADREAERALALAEQARDLGDLVDDIGKAGELRAELAALPGPVLRPLRPESAQVADVDVPATPSPVGPASYVLPVAGKLIAGFGEVAPGQPRSRGISLAVRPGAQAVAPAPGRVAFAGPYRGYGSIVIIEHPGGWTSLVTGLVQLDTQVGDTLVAGSPLGIAGAGRPVLSLELRRDGEPVNPLEYVGS